MDNNQTKTMESLVNKKSYLLPHKPLKIIKILNEMSSDLKYNFLTRNFNFIQHLDEEFVCLNEENKDYMLSFYKYDKNLLNINYETCNKTIEKFIFPNYQNKSIIAGGYFTKYQHECFIHRSFPTLFDKLTNQQDIDIFVDISQSHFKHLNEQEYLLHIRDVVNQIEAWLFYDHIDKIKNFQKYENYKDIKSFYSTLMFEYENEKINIMLNSKTIYEMVTDFDIVYSKVFYSYELKSIYLHNYMFNHPLLLHYDTESYLNCLKINKIEPLSDAEISLYAKSKLYNKILKKKILLETRKVKYIVKGFSTKEEIEELVVETKFFNKLITCMLLKHNNL
jgi:hypothetical protein